MLGNIAMALMHGKGAGVHYSRDDEHYARLRRWSPPEYSRRVMVSVVDEFEAVGIVEHVKVSPSSLNTLRSSIYPLVELRDLGINGVDQIVLRQADPIVLKDSEGRLGLFRDTVPTRHMRADVLEQNEMLRSLQTDLIDPNWLLDRHGLYRSDHQILNPRHMALYRVFNANFQRGGRFYRGRWPQLPKSARLNLLIAGEAVCEEDFSSCHLRPMCAIAGLATAKASSWPHPKMLGDRVPGGLDALACYGKADLGRDVRRLRARAMVGDEVRTYSTEPLMWTLMMGSGGFALVRDGHSIDYLQTRMN